MANISELLLQVILFSPAITILIIDRYGHTTTAIGPHLLIFGGWELNKAQNEVIVLRDCASVLPTEQLSKQGSKDLLLANLAGGPNL